jgi:hypothetical protein
LIMTVSAPPTPRSSAVTGSPARLLGAGKKEEGKKEEGKKEEGKKEEGKKEEGKKEAGKKEEGKKRVRRWGVISGRQFCLGLGSTLSFSFLWVGDDDGMT